MTREEGEELLPRDGLFPDVYAGVPVEEMLQPLGLDRESLQPILDRHTQYAAPFYAGDWVDKLNECVPPC